jgi:hypothetical protein
MSSILVTISMAILSFLSFKGLRKPARVKIRSQHSSRIIRAITPFVLALALFFAAPAPAEAAPSSPPGEGTFDCMPGGFDWGCQIMGYLFEDRGLQGTNLFNTTSNMDPTANQAGNLHPTSVQTALRVMMGFFSNAILIIASVILLYHFVVMVAETAHTGTIGGKETNQIWAPIRLVIAIGLLVPLASGLNSGQYITLQIAKWGAGLGSQAWKVFATAMMDRQTFALSNAPEIRELFVNALKSYTCQAIHNYYVDGLTGGSTARFANSRIRRADSPRMGGLQTRTFSAGEDDGDAVCGRITYEFPSGRELADRLTISNMNAFMAFEDQIRTRAVELARYFVGTGQRDPLRSTEYLDQIIADFQVRIIQDIVNISREVGRTKYQEIMEAIKQSAETYGWMSAGSMFLALTRAQGQMIASSNKMPIVSPPESDALTHLGNAAGARSYADFLRWLSSSARYLPPATAGGVGAGADIVTETRTAAPSRPSLLNVGQTVIDSARRVTRYTVEPGVDFFLETGIREGMDIYQEFARLGPREAAEFLFERADSIAKRYGVWQSSGAYNDIQNRPVNIGQTANPFAELMALGHRKLQAGIDLWGTAMLFVVQTIPMQFFTALIPYAGPATANMSATIGFGAAALYIFFSIFALMAGVYLAFVIPIMPFSRFFYAIVTWVAAVIEAMICIPFFALAHLTPKGEGAMGPRAKFGYVMLLQILVRPALTIFGLIGALLIFYVCVKFLNVMYYQAAGGLANFADPEMSGGLGFVARIIISIFYVALIYVSANMAFKMIDHLPRRALHWFGDQANEEHYHDEQGTMGGVASGVSNEISGNLVNIPNQLGQNARSLRLR